MSAILPTTGPAKVKEEAKAEGAGFDLADGGRSTDHGRFLSIALVKR